MRIIGIDEGGWVCGSVGVRTLVTRCGDERAWRHSAISSQYGTQCEGHAHRIGMYMRREGERGGEGRGWGGDGIEFHSMHTQLMDFLLVSS